MLAIGPVVGQRAGLWDELYIVLVAKLRTGCYFAFGGNIAVSIARILAFNATGGSPSAIVLANDPATSICSRIC